MTSTTVDRNSSSPRIVVVGTLALDVKFFDVGEYRCASERGVVWHRERHPGGVGRNVAVDLARLGATVSLVGMSADDDDARALEQHAAAAGVRVIPHRADGGVGTIELVLGPTGALRSTRISLPDLEESLAFMREDVEHAVLGADGVMVETGFDARFLRWLRGLTEQAGIPLCGMPTRSDVMAGYDVVVLNEREAARAVGEQPGGAEGAARHAGLLAGAASPSPARTVVVTRGAEGAVMMAAGCPEPVWVAAEAGPCLDDTGAGDALAAAFFSHLVRTGDAETALRRGMRAAGLTVRCRRATCVRLGAVVGG